ncbi:uncharacterized protein LOC123680950 [Harmonia axyridis]|uniref:uncharacterized protein LOC123680950 n=1 Tax=Harmonia axyridis TaxID=115357 RepID=UPI001E2757DF|nr:uncharacterized protein LOC123680950 [Harmonia axyridis]
MSTSPRRNAIQRNNSKSCPEPDSSDYVEEKNRNNVGNLKLKEQNTSNSNEKVSCRATYRTNRIDQHEISRSEDEDSDSEGTPNSTLNESSKFPGVLIMILIIIISLIIYDYVYNQSNRKPIENQETIKKQEISLKTIKKNFPSQEDKLWKSIHSGINQTIVNETPTSYIFLFESEAEETMKKLLSEISKYAVCKLVNCESSAIDFKKEITSNFSNINDYGEVISSFKGKLENNGLMIVGNLDEIPEKFALAFHNFCDEVTPLVKKSAFFFTMKVTKLDDPDRNHLRYIEGVLKEKWQNLETDKFVPIFTRITGELLKVYPESQTRFVETNRNPYQDSNLEST